jgi:hypothetical protein
MRKNYRVYKSLSMSTSPNPQSPHVNNNIGKWFCYLYVLIGEIADWGALYTEMVLCTDYGRISAILTFTTYTGKLHEKLLDG